MTGISNGLTVKKMAYALFPVVGWFSFIIFATDNDAIRDQAVECGRTYHGTADAWNDQRGLVIYISYFRRGSYRG